MTERERWIVYPLLFLALGAALRDKLVDRTTTKSIVCQELSIVDEEVIGQLSQRTLVKIGGTKPKPGGKSMGSFQINGDVELVDDDLNEHSPLRVLVKLGRTDPPPNVPSNGYAYVKGEVIVDGIVHSRQYTYQGIPFVPLQIAPGVPMPNVLQAMPHPGPKVPNPNVPNTKSPSQPPADDAKKGGDTAQPPSPADEGTTPAK
jgi:hypothetical protein